MSIVAVTTPEPVWNTFTKAAAASSEGSAYARPGATVISTTVLEALYKTCGVSPSFDCTANRKVRAALEGVVSTLIKQSLYGPTATRGVVATSPVSDKLGRVFLILATWFTV